MIRNCALHEQDQKNIFLFYFIYLVFICNDKKFQFSRNMKKLHTNKACNKIQRTRKNNWKASDKLPYNASSNRLSSGVEQG